MLKTEAGDGNKTKKTQGSDYYKTKVISTFEGKEKIILDAYLHGRGATGVAVKVWVFKNLDGVIRVSALQW